MFFCNLARFVLRFYKLYIFINFFEVFLQKLFIFHKVCAII